MKARQFAVTVMFLLAAVIIFTAIAVQGTKKDTPKDCGEYTIRDYNNGTIPYRCKDTIEFFKQNHQNIK